MCNYDRPSECVNRTVVPSFQALRVPLAAKYKCQCQSTWLLASKCLIEVIIVGVPIATSQKQPTGTNAVPGFYVHAYILANSCYQCVGLAREQMHPRRCFLPLSCIPPEEIYLLIDRFGHSHVLHDLPPAVNSKRTDETFNQQAKNVGLKKQSVSWHRGTENRNV